jgi:hypothetical protein
MAGVYNYVSPEDRTRREQAEKARKEANAALWKGRRIRVRECLSKLFCRKSGEEDEVVAAEEIKNEIEDEIEDESESKGCQEWQEEHKSSLTDANSSPVSREDLTSTPLLM